MNQNAINNWIETQFPMRSNLPEVVRLNSNFIIF